MRQLLSLAVGLALALGWPLALEPLGRELGGRALGTLLALVSVASLAASRSALPAELRLGAGAPIALLGVVAAALWTGEQKPYLLLPALVQLALARVFARSLRAGAPLIERAAFLIQPHAPDFVQPYCRTATKLWAWLFAANACAIAALAFAANLEAWRAFTSYGVWAVLGAFAALDFVVRKLYFRLYDDGAFDRLLARAFPAERTEMGRRSNAYRSETRRALGRDPRTGMPQAR